MLLERGHAGAAPTARRLLREWAACGLDDLTQSEFAELWDAFTAAADEAVCDRASAREARREVERGVSRALSEAEQRRGALSS